MLDSALEKELSQLHKEHDEAVQALAAAKSSAGSDADSGEVAAQLQSLQAENQALKVGCRPALIPVPRDRTRAVPCVGPRNDGDTRVVGCRFGCLKLGPRQVAGLL